MQQEASRGLYSEFYFSVLGAGPWFGHEMAGGQSPALEQRHQNPMPALAKHADQSQASRPNRNRAAMRCSILLAENLLFAYTL